MPILTSVSAFPTLRTNVFNQKIPLVFLFAVACFVMGAGPVQAQDRDILRQMEKAPLGNTDKVSDGDWRVVLGAGVGIVPKYAGSDEFTASPIPLIDITWRDRVFLNPRQGLGAYAIRTERFCLGVSVGYGAGRDQDDADRLRGLGDIDPAARGHLFGSYSMGPVILHADISQDFGGSDGLQIEPGATLMLPLSESVSLSTGLSATWASSDYMDAFFGVSGAQSARSGLPVYEASSGIKRADLKLAATWNVTEHWFATANAGVGYLLGDAADSPIVESEAQPSFGFLLGYRF